MVETPKSSAENLSTSREAIYWTENSQNSKLNQIKWLVKWNNNDQIKHLADLLKNKEYKQFQKEIWITWETNLDGKLWLNTLNKAKEYINDIQKDVAIETVTTDTKQQIDGIKQDLSAQIQQPGEVWNDNEIYDNWGILYTWNFENQQKEEIGSGEWIMEKWKRELQRWITLQWKDLIIKDIVIPEFDRETKTVTREYVSKKLTNISIRYIWKNICINNEYVLHPQWTICSYKERKFLDTYAEKDTTPSQDNLLYPLYNYLNKNRDKFEEKQYNTNTNNVAEDARWNSARQSASPESMTENLEWKIINEHVEKVELCDMDSSFDNNEVIMDYPKDYFVSSIAKEWNTLILNKWELKITLIGNDKDLKFVYYKNRRRATRLASKHREMSKKWNVWERRLNFYKFLDRKFFS